MRPARINLLKVDSSQLHSAHPASHLFNGSLYLVTEYCAAGSLLDVISQTQLPLEESQLAATLGAALGALAYLHDECQILHRDIKSANLLLTSEGEVSPGSDL